MESLLVPPDTIRSLHLLFWADTSIRSPPLSFWADTFIRSLRLSFLADTFVFIGRHFVTEVLVHCCEAWPTQMALTQP